MVGINSAIRTNDTSPKLYTQMAARSLRNEFAILMYLSSDILPGMTKCIGKLPLGMASSVSNEKTRQFLAPHRFSS